MKIHLANCSYSNGTFAPTPLRRKRREISLQVLNTQAFALNVARTYFRSHKSLLSAEVAMNTLQHLNLTFSSTLCYYFALLW